MKGFLLLILAIAIAGCRKEAINEYPPYYIAEELDKPMAIADGKIETSNGICFTNDGHTLYISGAIDRKFANGKPMYGIFRCVFSNGQWSTPEFVDLGRDIDAYHPVLSADNQLLFFNSRSDPDSLASAMPHDIWVAHKTNEGWSQPKQVAGINSSYYDSYPSIAGNKNIYFNSDRPGGQGGMDIYLSRYQDNSYQEPENITVINSPDAENDLVIDPDEKFMIFNRYIASTGELDLYIAFREHDSWQQPMLLGLINQEDEWELTPTLSPDRRYFFYELNGKIMQIELKKLLQSAKPN